MLLHPMGSTPAHIPVPIMNTLYKLLRTLLWKAGSSHEAKGSFPFGSCIITYALVGNGGTIEVHNPLKDIYLDNIAEWLMLNSTDRCTQSTEWNDHGFRSEADYLNYKYG